MCKIMFRIVEPGTSDTGTIRDPEFGLALFKMRFGVTDEGEITKATEDTKFKAAAMYSILQQACTNPNITTTTRRSQKGYMYFREDDGKYTPVVQGDTIARLYVYMAVQYLKTEGVIKDGGIYFHHDLCKNNCDLAFVAHKNKINKEYSLGKMKSEYDAAFEYGDGKVSRYCMPINVLEEYIVLDDEDLDKETGDQLIAQYLACKVFLGAKGWLYDEIRKQAEM